MAVADLEALVLAGLYIAGVSLAFTGNRTMLHVAVGNVVWFLFLFTDPRWALLGALVLFAAAFTAHVRRPKAYDDVLAGERDFGPVTFFGSFALVAGLWVALALPVWWVIYSILCMAFADPAGFYVGRRFGKHRLRTGKSFEGWGAVFAACLGLTAVLEQVLPTPGSGALTRVALVSLGASAGESLAPRHFDNLLMPVGALVGLGTAKLLTMLT